MISSWERNFSVYLSRGGGGVFAVVAGQPEEGEIEAGAEDVMFQFSGGEMLGDLGARGGDERGHRGGFTRRGTNAFRGERGPVMELSAGQSDMLGGILGNAEVRQEEVRRFAREDRGERRIPDAQIDVRRGSGGHDVGAALDSNARGGGAESGAL